MPITPGSFMAIGDTEIGDKELELLRDGAEALVAVLATVTDRRRTFESSR
jgi:hypothetical protein